MDRLDRKRQQVLEALGELIEQGQDRLRVGQVMTPDPACISADASILELVRLFHAKEFRHPLVTDAEGNLIGVVSDRDVIRCFGPAKYPPEEVLRGITAAEIMSTDVVTASPDDLLEQAIEQLFGYGINCLPVVSGGRLVGILTTTDLYVVLEAMLKTFRRSPTRGVAHAAAR
ncbi:MAG TPA: CBS domain-containing protein [Pirellulales bacterium]|nr:CBS domain-containing protein [Pirellulales bacterium]